MKKAFSLLAALCLAGALFGCSGGAAASSEAAPAAASSEETAVEAPAEVKALTVTAEDGFDSAGITGYVCTEGGTFELEPDGTDVTWTAFVLEEAFTDGYRYIPQACDPALEGAGTFALKEGQYLYLQCSLNGFTSAERPSGLAEVTCRVWNTDTGTEGLEPCGEDA